MAKKQTKNTIKQQNAARQERRRQYEVKRDNLMKIFVAVFGATLFVAIISLLITLFSQVVYVYNIEYAPYGQEAWVRGCAFLKALFTGTYTEVGDGYDDIAVPFYNYAKAYCQPAALMTLFSVVAGALTILFAALALVMAIWKKEYLFTYFTAIATLLTSVFIFVLYGIALSMANGDILSVYCNDNPLCSIRSDVVWAGVLSLLAFAGNVFAVVKLIGLERVRKGK